MRHYNLFFIFSIFTYDSLFLFLLLKTSYSKIIYPVPDQNPMTQINVQNNQKSQLETNQS